MINIYRRQLSIDIQEEELIWVCGKMKKDKIEIHDKNILRKIDLDYLFILNLIFENKFDRINTNVGIQSQKVKLFIMEMNYLDDDKIIKFVENKFKDQEDLLVEYNIFSHEDVREKFLNVLTMKRTDINEYREKLLKFKLKAKYLNLSNYNLVKLFNFNNKINRNYKIRDKNIMAVDLCEDFIEIVIFNNYEFKYQKKFSINSFENDILEDINIEIEDMGNIFSMDRTIKFNDEMIDYINKIQNILNMTVDYFIRKHKEDISYIVLVGKLSNVEGIDNYLTKELDKQVMILKSLDKIFIEDNLNYYAKSIGGLINGGQINYV